MPLLGALLLFAFAPSVPTARAGDICDYYRTHHPDFYALLCAGTRRRASVAGAQSTFATAFNVNPGTLPTEPTSYGLEGIGSFLRSAPDQWSPTFALVKGFHKFGTGISTSAANTFYSDDILQRTRSTPLLTTWAPLEPSTGYVTNLNVGGAVRIYAPQRRADLAMNLGFSFRYNKTTNTVGGGPGLLLTSSHFAAGLGVTREKVSNDLPPLFFATAMVSARFGFLELEYLMLVNSGGLGLSPINIGTLTATLGRFTLTGALRQLNYSQAGSVVQEHFAFQILLTKAISAGLLYNFIPGATSAALQYYL